MLEIDGLVSGYIRGSSVLHGQERRDNLIMQCTTGSFERNDVRAGAARDLEFVHCKASYRL